MKKSRRFGYSRLEFVAVFAITVVFSASLLPMLARGENDPDVTCRDNLKALGLAMAQYSQDFDGRYPSPCLRVGTTSNYLYYPNLLGKYVKTQTPFICPNEEDAPSAAYNPLNGFPGYGMNVLFESGGVCTAQSKGITKDSITHPAELLMLTDNDLAAKGATGYYSTWYDKESSPYKDNVGLPEMRHNDGANVLFADGHVAQTRSLEIMTIPAKDANKWRMWYPAAP